MKKISCCVSLAIVALAFQGVSGAQKDKAAPKAPDLKMPSPFAEMAKRMEGKWTCSGKAELGGQVRTDPKVVITNKLNPTGYLIQSSLVVTWEHQIVYWGMITTHDATANKWYRMSASTRGAHGHEWGTLIGNKVTWEGERWSGEKKVAIRGADENVSPKEVHITGESSDDGGKTWKFDHDVSCKK